MLHGIVIPLQLSLKPLMQKIIHRLISPLAPLKDQVHKIRNIDLGEGGVILLPVGMLLRHLCLY